MCYTDEIVAACEAGVLLLVTKEQQVRARMRGQGAVVSKRQREAEDEDARKQPLAKRHDPCRERAPEPTTIGVSDFPLRQLSEFTILHGIVFI